MTTQYVTVEISTQSCACGRVFNGRGLVRGYNGRWLGRRDDGHINNCWFPYEYIDDEVKKKLDETKGQLAGDEMEKETKHYVESLNHDPNWLKKILIEIDKSLINCEYIAFFMLMYMQW